MDIKKYLFNVLNQKEIIDLLPDKKVFFLHALNPNKQMYLEYEVINEYGAEYSENNEDYTTYLVQVDIFSTGNYANLENVVKKIMKDNGFERDMAVDLYEDSTGLNHKATRFRIDLPS